MNDTTMNELMRTRTMKYLSVQREAANRDRLIQLDEELGDLELFYRERGDSFYGDSRASSMTRPHFGTANAGEALHNVGTK